MSRPLGLLFSVLLLLAAPAAAPAADAGSVRAALARDMRAAGGGSGALVVDLETGRRLYARRPDTPRVPASVNKLFVTAAALDRFGAEETLDTTVLADVAPVDGVLEGNLYLRGAGDPTLSTAGLRSIAEGLATEAGLTEVSGRVIGDESLFDSLRGGPTTNFALDGWIGPLSALTLNRGRTGSRRRPFVASPPRHAAQGLARALRKAGVSASVTRARSGVTPREAVEILRWPSPTIGRLARLANTPSDNFVAETLLKVLGAHEGRGGTTSAGAAVVRRVMARLGLRPRVVDGSGLSRGNRTTPRQVVRLLRQMAADDAFRESLAVAGRTGTLIDRLRRSRARDNCTGKTGTLIGVSALAGYCETPAGPVAYAFLMNGVWAPSARRVQDRLLVDIMRYTG